MRDFVGVMDSGIGGLTVLRELLRVAPTLNYVYFADHAYCPYGTRPLAQIRARVLEVASYLARQGAKSIVVACNTASIFAEDMHKLTKLPIYDVISPTCKVAAQLTRNKRVALLATNATVRSLAYHRILQSYKVQTLGFACSAFVPLVESNAGSSQLDAAVEVCLSALPSANCDTVILGCTHFPLITAHIARKTGDSTIVSCSIPVAQQFVGQKAGSCRGEVHFFTTGNAYVAEKSACGIFKARFNHLDI